MAQEAPEQLIEYLPCPPFAQVTPVAGEVLFFSPMLDYITVCDAFLAPLFLPAHQRGKEKIS